jgi:hypothetical protein
MKNSCGIVSTLILQGNVVPSSVGLVRFMKKHHVSWCRSEDICIQTQILSGDWKCNADIVVCGLNIWTGNGERKNSVVKLKW